MRLAAMKVPAILLLCVCTLLTATTAFAADSAEDQVLKGSETTAGAVKFDSGTSSGTVSNSSMDATRVLLALGLVLAAIFLVRWIGQQLLLKNGGPRANKAIQVVSRSMLSPKQQVLMLRVGKRIIVVGDNGGQMNALCEISDPDEVAGLIGESPKEPAEPGKSFGALFRRAEEPFEEQTEPPPEPVGLDEATTRQEINGLLDKVQLMRKQFKST